MRVKKDKHKVREGKLGDKKGFIITESKQLEFMKDEIFGKQPLKMSNERTMKIQGDKIIITETAEYFNDPMVFWQSASKIARTIGETEQYLETEHDKDRQTAERLIKTSKLLLKEYSKHEKRMKELISDGE